MLDSLLLVRHGEVHNPGHVVYADLPGFALSRRGRRQAAETAARLTDADADALVASPLQRAVETAEPIAGALGLDLETDDRLVEWRLSARWAGVPWDDVDRAFPGELTAYLDHPHRLPFTPETIDEAAARVAAVVADLGTRFPGGRAIVVGHQDPTQAVRLLLTGRGLDRLHTDKPDHGTVVELRAGDPWSESGRWDPPSTAEPFPPMTTEAGDPA